MEEQLKQCLYTLHLLHIAHKDIKMDNILFSNRFKRFVLSDFGISEYVKEVVGQKTLTTYGGTVGFMSAEMSLIR